MWKKSGEEGRKLEDPRSLLAFSPLPCREKITEFDKAHRYRSISNLFIITFSALRNTCKVQEQHITK
jgi:hypothetical protein